jgi:hypothetical protein
MTEENRPKGEHAVSRRRWCRWAALTAVGAVTVALLAAAAFLFLPGGNGQSLEAVRAEAVRKGIAGSMKAFTAKLPAVPKESNAAIVYENAFAANRTWGAYKEDSELVPYASPMLATRIAKVHDPALKQAIIYLEAANRDPRTPMPENILRDSEAYISRREGTLDLIHQAAVLPEARWEPISNGVAAGSNYPGELHGATHLVCLATLADAEEQRPAEALLKARDGIKMVRSLEGQPSLRWCRDEAEYYSLLQYALMSVIARSEPSNEDLAAAQVDIERFADGISARLPIECEFADSSDRFDSFAEGRTTAWGGRPSTYLRVNGGILEGPVNRYLPSWIVRPYIKADTTAMLRYLIYAAGQSDHPDMEFIRMARTQDTSANPIANVIASEHYPMAGSEVLEVAGFILAVELARAEARAAAAGLGALRFKNDTGGWPSSLEALVPKYLEKVPADPFSEEALLYRAEGNGVMIYSVGENQKDDGGRGPGLLYEDDDRKKGRDDRGFRIWK